MSSHHRDQKLCFFHLAPWPCLPVYRRLHPFLPATERVAKWQSENGLTALKKKGEGVRCLHLLPHLPPMWLLRQLPPAGTARRGRKGPLGLQSTFSKAGCRGHRTRGIPPSPYPHCLDIRGVDSNPFRRFLNLCTCALPLRPWHGSWPCGVCKRLRLPQEGHVGDHHPFFTPVPLRTPAARLRLRDDRPVFLNCRCSRGFPGISLTWVSEELSEPQSPSVGSPQRNTGVFQKPRGAGLDMLRSALTVSPSPPPSD